ncbi:hypothetical protein [Janibacter anophelis]|uniref:hypothetical protein n=1 Tax=Janibacter anophelis TaxID=319054 RepID=UPI000DEEBCC1|nr:hypothetical protein [Janibacter anophelis]
MYTFPKSRDILFEILNMYGTPAFRLEVGWDTAWDMPVHHIQSLGGTTDGPFRTDRIRIDTYAIGDDAANDAAEALQTALADRHHYAAGHEQLGLIDRITVESGPALVTYPSDTLSLVSATYRAATRPLA